jgi:hypothetical protein
MRNRSSRLAAVAAIVAGGLWAQQPELKPASVEGAVTNSVTGEPILRAHVMLRMVMPTAPSAAGQSYGAMTGADGSFSIRNLPPGGYSVAIERVGFVMPIENAVGGRGTYLTLLPDARKSGFNLKLAPVGGIGGRVLDADGEPVEGALVSVTGGQDSFASATSDEAGRFRVGGLAPGTYRVNATPASLRQQPEIRTDGSKEKHFATTWYPGAVEEKGAARVRVPAGADATGIDIPLVATPLVRVSGRVTGNAAGQRGSVRFYSGTTSSNSTSVQPDGTFEIWGVDPGRYTLRAMGNPQWRSAPLEIDVGTANVDRLELPLMAPFAVSGSVEYLDEDARPRKPQTRQSAQSVGGQPAPQPTVLPRMLIFMALNGGTPLPPVNVAEDGTFRIETAYPDRYRVTLSWNNAYVKSNQVGPRLAEGALVDFRYGGAPLTLRLSSDLAEVSGKVEGEPAETAGMRAVLMPQEADGRGPTFNRQPDGGYLFRVPPGRYLLLVVDEADYLSMQRGQSAEEFLEKAEKLELGPREKQTRDLKPLRAQGQ